MKRWKIALIVSLVLGLICLTSCGRKKAAAPKVGVLFANFDTESDDSCNWGEYICTLLHSKIPYAPNQLMFVPNLFRTDAVWNRMYPYMGKKDISMSDKIYLARLYNINNILRGKVTKKGTTLSFEGDIYDYAKSKSLSTISVQGSINDPGDFMNRLSLEVLNKMKVSLTPENNKYLARNVTGNSTAFAMGAQLFDNDDTNDESLVNQILSQDKDFWYVRNLWVFSGASTQQESMQRIEQNLRDFPDSVYLKTRALLYLERVGSDNPRMVSWADEILKDNPLNMEALGFKAEALMWEKKHEDAIKVAETMVQTYPNCWFSHDIRRYVFAEIASRAQDGRYIKDMSRADRETMSKANAEDTKESRIAYEMNPRDPYAISKMVDPSWDDEENEKYFSKVTAIDPGYFEVYERMWVCYIPGYSNQPYKCRQVIAEGVRLNPDRYKFAHLALYNIWWHTEVYPGTPDISIYAADSITIKKAAQCVVDVWKKNLQPAAAADCFRDIKMLDRVGEVAKAWELLEILPRDQKYFQDMAYHEVLTYQCMMAHRLQKYDKVHEYGELALQSGACNVCAANVYYTYSLVDFHNNDKTAAFANMEKALASDPNDAFIKAEYAYYAAQYNYNLDVALKYIREAIKERPSSARNYGILARLYYSKNDKKQAVLHIKEALSRDADNEWLRQVKAKIDKM